MSHYQYKGFNLLYKTNLCTETNYYKAHGWVKLIKNDKTTVTQEFRTQSVSLINATEEIKHLMERYIDFECQQYERLKSI